MRVHRNLRVTLVLLLYLGTLAPAARGEVLPPATFWGTLTLAGLPAADGVILRALIQKVEYASTTTFTAGGQSGRYVIDIPSDDPNTPDIIEGGQPGQTITFAVDGYTIVQTGTWASGPSQLDLTGTVPTSDTPVPTATPTPTSAATAPATATVTPAHTPTAPSAMGSIGGSVYADMNRNGMREPDEAGVAGFLVTATLDGGNLSKAARTNHTGDYAITGLPTGNYTVSIVLPPAFTATTPSAFPVAVTKDMADPSVPSFGVIALTYLPATYRSASP